RPQPGIEGPPDLPIPRQKGRFDLREAGGGPLWAELLGMRTIDDLAVARPAARMGRDECVALEEADVAIIGPEGHPGSPLRAGGRDAVVIRSEADTMAPPLHPQREHDIGVVRCWREGDELRAFLRPQVHRPAVRRPVDPLVHTLEPRPPLGPDLTIIPK